MESGFASIGVRTEICPLFVTAWWHWGMETTAKTPVQHQLFPTPPDPGAAVVVNDRVTIRTSGGERVVVVSGLVLHHYAVEDRVAEAYAMVSLVDCGYADQNDVSGLRPQCALAPSLPRTLRPRRPQGPRACSRPPDRGAFEGDDRREA